jgi:MFS transporter, SHS family, lactate transporter
MSGLVAMLREPTKQQYYGFFAAWSGWVLDAFDFTVFFIAMPYIAKEFGVQHVATTGSIALTLLARLIGGWLAGIAADKWGRKLPLLISVVWFALCDGAVSLAPTFGTVLILRTLFGVGMGAEWTSGTTMAMESWPKRSRGIASGVLQGSWALGYILAALVSWWVLPRWGWRAMFAFAALPALLAIPMRWWVKEDPEVEARLAHEKYAFPLKRAFKEDPTMLKKVMWGSAIMAVGFGAYYAITGSYNPMLKEEMGATSGRIALLIIVFNIGMLIGSILVGFIATKRSSTAAITIPAALSLLVLPLYVGLGITNPSSPVLALGAFLGGAIGCGFCGATPLVLTSLFPTEVRARLVGLVYHIGACFAAFVPMATVALSKWLGIKLSLSICLVAGVLELAVVVLVLAPAISARMVRRTMAAGGVAAATIAGIYVTATASTGCMVSNISYGPEGGAASNDPNDKGGSPPVTVEGDDPSKNPDNVDTLTYRDINNHPGCSTAGLETRKALSYTAANIPGYKCAAKAYPMPKGDDPKKPIILLVHGNSSTPADYEKFPVDTGTPQLADRLSEAGYRVLAVDFRHDLTDDPKGNNDTENAGQNFDHGWAVPILEHFIDSVMTAWPEQKISVVGFSVAPTVIRDSLRRLHRANKKPFERIDNLVYVAGSHHGVSTFRKLCGSNPTMRGKIACELGDRTSYQTTEFHKPLNGPNGDWETPCLDGETAYGQKGVCGGNKVKYTTIVMKDVKEGTYQDEFVSEGSSKLKGARNLTVELTDNDTSGYFYNGLFKNHYGALRSDAALKILVPTLTGEQTN